MTVVSVIFPVNIQLTANKIAVTIPLYSTVFARILLLFTRIFVMVLDIEGKDVQKLNIDYAF